MKISSLLLMACALFMGPGAFAAGAPGLSTNIVLITVDNLGYGDLALYGNTVIRTPTLDQFAREGVVLRQLYSAAPICSPSRGALLTGRYPRRNGLVDVLPTEPQNPPEKGNLGPGLALREKLLPEFLHDAGYRTAAFGKWHIGFSKGSRPTERGFDEYFGNASGTIDYYFHLYAGRPDLYRGGENVKVPGYSTDLYTEAALDFIQRNARRKFFLYLPFNAPCYNGPKNVPEGEKWDIWQAPLDVIASYGPGAELDQKRRYAAVVTALDRATGRVLRKLDDLGLRENTLVIWWSDNGAFMMNENVGLGTASNAPLRDGGTKLWEGGIRVPGIVRWPGRLPAGVDCNEPLIAMDFFPLVLRAAGIPLPTDRILDGVDPIAALRGEARSPHHTLFWDFRAMSAVREGDLKLVREKRNSAWQLFDLRRDIGETHDLAAENPAATDRLKRAFEHWVATLPEEP